MYNGKTVICSEKKRDMLTMLIIVLVAMSGLMGIDIYLPSVPHIMKLMNASSTEVKLLVSIYLLGFSISLLAFGPLSDKFGRKPVVISGLFFACIMAFATLYIQHITSFLILRFLQGLGAGASAGMGRSLAVDMFHKKTLKGIRSYFSAVISLSPLIAPVIGGYLQHYIDWQASFVFLGVLFLVLLVCFSFFTPETNQHIHPELSFKDMYIINNIELLKSHSFIAATILGGIGMTVSIAYASLSPFVFQIQYHLSPITFGWLTMSISVGVLLGRLLNGYFISKWGNVGVLKFGILLVLIPGFIILALELLHIDILIIFCFTVLLTLSGQSFIRSNAMFVAMLSHHHKRGAAGALFGSFQTVVAVICGFIISFYPNEGFLLLGALYSLGGLVSFIIFNGFIKNSAEELC